MWYEYQMIQETLDSVTRAIGNTTIPVDIAVCFNKQTYIEKPEVDNIDEVFEHIRLHPLLTNATIVEKTDNDPFYNIADWRREVKSSEGYTVWGESDSILPKNYFAILQALSDVESFNIPHIVTLASRKCWDASWSCVEHVSLRDTPHISTHNNVQFPLNHHDYINQEQLDEFNDGFGDPEVIHIVPAKIDGSTVALSPNLPQLIPDDMHFAREDFCLQIALGAYAIPQFHVHNVLKGHNYQHPLKRVNTLASRDDSIWKEYEGESIAAMNRFISSLYK
jgi:hypothetical protein